MNLFRASASLQNLMRRLRQMYYYCFASLCVPIDYLDLATASKLQAATSSVPQWPTGELKLLSASITVARQSA